jgi:hypothetical protein
MATQRSTTLSNASSDCRNEFRAIAMPQDFERVAVSCQRTQSANVHQPQGIAFQIGGKRLLLHQFGIGVLVQLY